MLGFEFLAAKLSKTFFDLDLEGTHRLGHRIFLSFSLGGVQVLINPVYH